MSHTVAHRPHVQHPHVPLLPVLAVIVAICIAAAVIYAVNQPRDFTITTTVGEVAGMPQAAPGAPPVLESPVFRHALMSQRLSGAELQAFKYGRLHQVDGASLDPVSVTPHRLERAELMALPTPWASGEFELPR